MEALLSSLIKLDVPNTHCVDASGHLTRLAFTSTKAVQLTHRFGNKGGEGGRSKSAGWEDQPPNINASVKNLNV
jgi:hypothetical protein